MGPEEEVAAASLVLRSFVRSGSSFSALRYALLLLLLPSQEPELSRKPIQI